MTVCDGSAGQGSGGDSWPHLDQRHMEGFGILGQSCQADARVINGRLPIDDRRRIRL